MSGGPTPIGDAALICLIYAKCLAAFDDKRRNLFKLVATCWFFPFPDCLRRQQKE